VKEERKKKNEKNSEIIKRNKKKTNPFFSLDLTEFQIKSY
jgi:hypothetical protein